MINLAHTMKMDLDDQKSSSDNELTLQFLFLDGEEAFVKWTSTDSIYGARHLASKLEASNYEYNRIQGSELDRMDIFVLLDLLGAKDPNIISSQVDTDVSLATLHTYHLHTYLLIYYDDKLSNLFHFSLLF